MLVGFTSYEKELKKSVNDIVEPNVIGLFNKTDWSCPCGETGSDIKLVYIKGAANHGSLI